MTLVIRYDMSSLNPGDLKLKDFSGHENHGTINGAAKAPGRIGGAYRFDGSGDYVQVTDSNSLDATQVTVAAWITTDSVSGTASAVRKDAAYFIRRNTSSIEFTARISAVDRTVTSTTTLTAGSFVHVAGTYDGSTVRLYINGVEEGTPVSISGSIDTNANDLFVGSANASVELWEGIVDEVYIFNSALSESEIAELAGGQDWAFMVRQSEDDAWEFLDDFTMMTFDKGISTLGKAEVDVYSLTEEPAAPVLSWDMESLTSNGKMKDLSANTNDGTISGTSDASGKWGRGRDFDGTDDRIQVTDDASFKPASALSVAAWVNIDVFQDDRIVDRGVFGTNNGYVLRLKTTGRVSLFVGDGTTNREASTPNNTLAANTWHHVAGTFDGTDVKIYVDGVLEDTQSFASATTISYNAQDLWIGSEDGGTTSNLDGTIDEVRIFTSTLTSDEIAVLADDHYAEADLVRRESDIAILDADQKEWFRGKIDNVDDDPYSLRRNVKALGKAVKAMDKLWVGRKEFVSLPADIIADEVTGSLDGEPISGQVFRYDMATLTSDGKMKDLSGNSNDGTITGSLDTDGKWGRARNFDGVDDEIQVPDSSELSGMAALTVAGWVRPLTTGNTDMWLSKNSTYRMYHDLTEWKFQFATSGQAWATQFDSNIRPRYGEWVHLCVTYDSVESGNNMLWYVDGEHVNSRSATGSIVSTSTVLLIANDAAAGREFPGDIDEVYIYDRALSPDEVRILAGKSVLRAGFHKPSYGTLAFDMETLDNDGNMKDFSGNGNAGTLTGTTTVDGQFGKARDFDGADDLIAVTDAASLDITSAITISAWINTDTVAAGIDTILTKGSAYEIDRSGANIRLTTYSSTTARTTTSSGTISADVWHHVAGTYDGANHKIYIDGVLDEMEAQTGSIDSTANNLVIGQAGGDTQVWDGTIDDVRVYPAALDEREIGFIMNRRIRDFRTISFRSEADHRLPVVDGVVDIVGGEWLVESDADDNDAIVMMDKFGSDVSQDTFQFGSDIVDFERRVDSERLYTDIEALGYGDGADQLRSRAFHATTTRTELVGTVSKDSTRAMNVSDASAFPANGVVYVGMERIQYVGKDDTSSPNKLGTTSITREYAADGHASLDSYAHDENIPVVLHVDDVAGIAKTPENPEDESAIKTLGWKQGRFTDKAIVDQNTLDRLASRLLDKYRSERESLKLWILQGTITADLGDVVTVNEIDGTAYRNSPYRIMGLRFTWPDQIWEAELQNFRETAERGLAKMKEDLSLDSVYGQGSRILIPLVETDNIEGGFGPVRPKLKWDMETLSGSDMKDFSVHAQNGTITGTTDESTSTAGWGNYRKFAGATDKIQISNPNFSNDQQGAYAMWVRTNATGDVVPASFSTDGSFDDEFHWWFRGGVANRCRVNYNINGAISWNAETDPNALTDDTWHHVVLQSDGLTTRLYVDNVEKTLTDLTGTNSGQWFGDVTDANRFTVGGIWRAAVTNPWEDDVDEVQVFSRALTSAERDILKASGPPTAPNFPLSFDLEVPSEVVAINDARILRLRLSDYRAYVGGEDNPSTSIEPSGGPHSHSYDLANHTHTFTTFDIPDTSTGQPIPSGNPHAHAITFTTHNHGGTSGGHDPILANTDTDPGGATHSHGVSSLALHGHSVTSGSANASCGTADGHTHTLPSDTHSHQNVNDRDLQPANTGTAGTGSHSHSFDPDSTGHTHTVDSDGQASKSTDPGIDSSENIHTHNWTLPNHDHGDSGSTDWGSVTTSSETDASHAHTLEHGHTAGIFEDTYSGASIGIVVTDPDDTATDQTTSLGGPWTTDQVDISLKTVIDRAGTWKVDLYDETDGRLGRIQATVIINAFIKSS